MPAPESMICIVSGPSCAGKSSFLSSPARLALGGLPPSAPVLFPSGLLRHGWPGEGSAYLHYNLLRRADAALRLRRGAWLDFRQDAAWARLLAMPCAKRALVLVAGRGQLLQRMARREQVEPELPGGPPPRAYPRAHWLRLLQAVDLQALYLAWAQELERHAIPATYLRAAAGGWQAIPRSALEQLDLNGARP